MEQVHYTSFYHKKGKSQEKEPGADSFPVRYGLEFSDNRG